ncbi:MAG: PAS domain S-box protein [Candidatus Edwardsbacteria bacterium]|nr:PAS domain S-box protein [Candidatus Edwardsbacteria bacterium]MBU1577049.1 PAS domain S-box protein [Candidatus Edwardsbacteria bacterium]MBU2464189.1 PAS domain S-box protein [Candidatus Edwardsbacteria bacterium]MBU2593791.1 PAS domain S-box protein [Candidatus Edwardsbacteria bacterium]
MFTKIKSFIIEYLAIFTGILFGLAFWIVDILIDVFMFKEGTLKENLISPEPMEIYFRMIVGTMFVAFGVYNYFISLKRKAVANKLAETNREYRALFDNMLNGLAYCQLITDELNNPVDFILLEANPVYYNITGLTADRVLGQRASAATPWILKGAIDWLDIYGRAALKSEETKMEVYSKHLDKWLLVSVYSPAQGFFVTITEDITERKRIDSVLRENQERTEAIFEAVHAGILVIDRETHTIIYANKQAALMIGVPVNDILNRKCNKFICTASDGACPITDLHQTIDNSEKCVINVKGEMIPILKTVTPTIMGEREVLVESFVDISELKQAELALNAEAIRRRILIDQSRDGIVVLAQDGSVYESNRRFAEMLGFLPEEIKQLHVWDWEFQHTREQVIDMIRNVDETGDFFETRHRRKDGTIFDVEISTNGAIFEGDKLIFCVCRDSTERKQNEALQSAIYKISEISTTAENLLELYSGIHMVVDEMMSTTNFYIALYNEKEDRLDFPYFVDERDASPVSRPLKKGLTEYVLRNKKPLLAPPMVQRKMADAGEIEMVGTPSVDWMGVPLNIGKTIFGVLVVQSYREEVRFGAREISTLNFISDNIAAAILRKKAEDERKRLVKELQESLNNIKTLKGLVPICSSCKKIRNDSGYWQQVEVYVAEHTEADFSHGICDECAHKLYPQYFKDKKNKTQGDEVG